MFPPPALPWSGLTRECRIAREPDFCLKRCPAGAPGTVRRLPGRDRLPIFPPGSVLLARFLPERGRGYPPGGEFHQLLHGFPDFFPPGGEILRSHIRGKFACRTQFFQHGLDDAPGGKHAAGRSGMNEAPPSLPPGIFHWAGYREKEGRERDANRREKKRRAE